MDKIAGLMRQDTGVGYYRVGQPVHFINRFTPKPLSKITPFSGENMNVSIGELKDTLPAWSDKTLMELSQDADVIWTTLLFNEDEIIKLLNLRKWSGAKWIVDIDDNMYAVSSDNPGKRNVEIAMREMEKCLMVADGVTVSVPNLKEAYLHLNKNIYVKPNGLDFSWFKTHKYKNSKVRIGWRGAYGHRADIQLLEGPINALKKDYNIELVTFGVKPSFKSEHHDWVRFLDYPQELDKLELDIAVVPLINSPYNQCKSNLAILEYSALKIPVVASPTENQKGMPIMYATNNYEWYNQLERLIKDRKLRESNGKEQYDFALKNYNEKNLVKPLIKFFEELPRKDM
jgi:glycosyltransferase involved in cell wall biosynthesis